MARYKKTQIIHVRIPLEDYQTLIEYYDKIAPPIRKMIEEHLLHKTQELHKRRPKSAIGYCNNNDCLYGNTPERIRLIFDEEGQAWYCSNCKEFTPDVDEKTIRWEES